MKKLFELWLGLMILIYTVFTPIYLFSNSSTDEVEEITFEQIIAHLSYRGISQAELERKIEILQELNVETDKSLIDALEDIDGVDDISVDILETRDFKVNRDDFLTKDLDRVQLSFNYKDNRQYKLDFIVLDKNYFLPSLSEMLSLQSVSDSTLGNYNKDMMWNFFQKVYHEDNPSV